IVDNYLASKMKETIDVAVQLQTNKLREEAQAENHEFLNQIEKYVTESLEAKVLVRSTNQTQTSYAVAASLSEFKLKKILIDKMESNKSIDRSDIQKDLYKALVKSYNSDKDIISSYVDDLEDQSHQEFNIGNDDENSVREALNDDESQCNQSSSPTPDREWYKTKILKIDNMTQEVLTGPTYDLIKGTCKSVVELEYHLEEVFKATNDRLDWHNPKGKPYPYDLSKPFPLILNEQVKVVYDKHSYWGIYHWGPKRQKFYGYATNMESSKDVYSRHKIIAVTSLKIMQFFGYSHLEEIIVRRQDDQLYNSTNVHYRRIVIQECVEDLQLGVESYQKKINLTKLNTYHSDLKRMNPYTAYPDIQGIIYEDEMNRNRLMRTDELHKFSDGILNHVRTALNDIDRGIDMEYFPKRKWSKQHK
ncbi:hypothetical protein Tco_0889516, partial [Tanacetum coccineum]